MAIKGLTDRGLAFPEIGQIRKGAPKQKNAPGKDLTYFRVEFAKGEDEAAELFAAAYPEEPREINIMLPFDEIDRQWEAYLEGYTAGRLVARSDGEKFLYWSDSESMKPKVINGEPYTPYKKDMVVGKDYKGKPVYCKPNGRLRVIVPELKRAACMLVLTTSINDIVNLSDQLRAIQIMNGGRLSGVPMVLKRRPKQISVPKEDGSRVRMPKYMLSIEADPKWVRLKMAEMALLALPEIDPALLLPDGEVIIEGESTDLTGQQQDPQADPEPAQEAPGVGVRAPEHTKDYGAYYEYAEFHSVSQEDAYRLVKDAKDADAMVAFKNLLELIDQMQQPVEQPVDNGQAPDPEPKAAKGKK